jgi:putative two-component system response regulator
MVDKRYKIILVDDNETNLTLGKNMLRTFYEVYPVNSAEKMFALLEKIMPDLILLDIEMPDMDGYEAMHALKASKRFGDIPVIFVTARVDEGSELEGLSLGAIDYVYKPFYAPLLLKRIENHLLLAEQRNELASYRDNLEELIGEKTREVTELQNAVLDVVAEIVEYRDDVTGGHVTRTQKYVELLIKKVVERGLYPDSVRHWDMDFIVPSAQLHDVGKIAIPDTILKKPGKLTEEEFETMKQHTVVGVDMIEGIENTATEHSFMRHARIIAGTHHEKWDGSGYPVGLRGEDIPLEGRIMAIADVYDALISSRPYKEPFSPQEAKRIIIEGKGVHFDPELVDVFEEVADGFAQIAHEASDNRHAA